MATSRVLVGKRRRKGGRKLKEGKEEEDEQTVRHWRQCEIVVVLLRSFPRSPFKFALDTLSLSVWLNADRSRPLRME